MKNTSSARYRETLHSMKFFSKILFIFVIVPAIATANDREASFFLGKVKRVREISSGRVRFERSFDVDGNTLDSLDAYNPDSTETTAVQYDESGRRTISTTQSKNFISTTKYTYSKAGDLVEKSLSTNGQQTERVLSFYNYSKAITSTVTWGGIFGVPLDLGKPPVVRNYSYFVDGTKKTESTYSAGEILGERYFYRIASSTLKSIFELTLREKHAYYYNNRGLLIKEEISSNPAGGHGMNRLSIDSSYDERDRLLQKNDLGGNIYDYKYAADGKLIRIQLDGKGGHKSQRVESSYDPQGKLVSESSFVLNTSSNTWELSKKRAYERNSLGDLAREKAIEIRNGKESVVSISDYIYESGRLLRKEERLFQNNVFTFLHIVNYKASGEVASEVLISSDKTEKFLPVAIVTVPSYDQHGRLFSEIGYNVDGMVSWFVSCRYDLNGRLLEKNVYVLDTATVAFLNNNQPYRTETYTFSADTRFGSWQSRVIELRETKGTLIDSYYSPSRRITRALDKAGNLEKYIDEDGATFQRSEKRYRYKFDDSGNWVQKIESIGAVENVSERKYEYY